MKPLVKTLVWTAVVLAALAGAATLWLWRIEWRPSQPPHAGPQSGADAMVYRGQAPPDELGALLAGRAEVPAALPAGAAPLDRLPGGLAMPTGAKMLSAWKQGQGLMAEEIAVCSLPRGSAAGVLAELVTTAQAAGYGLRAEPAPDSRLLQAPGRSLLLRARQAGGEVRMTFILRYTSPGL
jgi:hypothetical protein